MTNSKYIPESAANERWQPIPGYDGRYEASSEGRIRRVKGKGCNNGNSRILKVFMERHGYNRTAIVRDGKTYKPGVHVLVALAFLGECPDGCEVDRLDNNKSNNRPDNLEYVTHKENHRRVRAIKKWGRMKP